MSFIYICLFTILFIITLLYLLTFFLAAHSPINLDLLLPYECGFTSIGNNRIKFEIIYYLIAILYLIFDLEILFLFPFASIFSSLTFFSLSFGMIFIFILTFGFLYELTQKALTF